MAIIDEREKTPYVALSYVILCFSAMFPFFPWVYDFWIKCKEMTVWYFSNGSLNCIPLAGSKKINYDLSSESHNVGNIYVSWYFHFSLKLFIRLKSAADQYIISFDVNDFGVYRNSTYYCYVSVPDNLNIFKTNFYICNRRITIVKSKILGLYT